ncbi:unnamed protein product [Rotaria sordida]|uniref:F-box domain-containing protein n=1 Tax=Rotaria sordida TaxID=392033 RepID=A0A815Y159_9BILA|nr:unnamed protein product [Rotaria sordida]CAF1564308.1 unnamed protein product [Rotaria sordida]
MKLNDLPDEILLILKKFDNTEVLYSFIGVNKRFNKLVHDSIFTNHLTMTRCSSNGSFDRLDNQMKQLPNLKLVLLYSEQDTDKYNELIVPLLHRMINLEELDLHFVVYCKKRFIDGYDLKYNIINNLLQLNKFVFNIGSCLPLNDQAYLSLNEDCQLSFNGFKNNKIISCIDYFPDRKEG